MEKGILTSAQEKELAQMLDDVLKLKGVLELIDGFLAKTLITLLDDTIVDKLKTELKVKLATLVDAAIAKDVELSEKIASEILADLIDIPGLDEESEGLIFKGAIELIVGAILARLSAVKGEIVTLK